ncbi:2-octaprenyl-6-methoxyphenyl hydroxylase [Veronia pacifica]|uniref:2-octaprenyl-6-methoxyphenyl hydroxylase n=1 Tax=Veronia pacifica TaxID=1080227 RepID=UPI00362AEC98
MANTQDETLFDLVIAGGAMAGATLALAVDTLTGGRAKIAIVEAAEPDDNHPGYDARCIAIAYGSCQILKEFGLWSTLASNASPIQHIHISDRGHFGQTAFSASHQGLPYLGNVIELTDAGQFFHQALSSRPAISVFCPSSVSSIERSIDSVSITLCDGRKLSSKLMVAADGAVSACCDMVGLSRHQHDFNQVAIIANVSTELPHQGEAFERFTPYGPVALLPMTRGRSSLVWCVPPDKLEETMALSDRAFLSCLQSAFGWRLGKLTEVGQRHSYPLILRQAEQIISHRFAVVGNAAQALHPIAGQGFNLGLRDVATLADEIATRLNNDQDCGDMTVLQGYRKRRETDRDKTVMITSGLVKGFSNHSGLLALVRNLGLNAMTAFPALKSPLLKQTMGLVKR